MESILTKRLLCVDFFNLQRGEGLSMPLLFGKSFPPFHLEGDHLLGPALAQDFSHDLDIGKHRSSCEDLLSFRVKKNIRKFYGLAGIALYFFDLNGVAGGNFILFSTRPDYCVHVILPTLKLNLLSLLQKYFFVVRQDHHERKN